MIIYGAKTGFRQSPQPVYSPTADICHDAGYAGLVPKAGREAANQPGSAQSKSPFAVATDPRLRFDGGLYGCCWHAAP